MINSIEFHIPHNTDVLANPYYYWYDKCDIIPLKLKDKIEFKEGTNILVGPNGCGKSTIINMLRDCTFCRHKWFSSISHTSSFGYMGDERNWITLDSIDVQNDYNRKVFNLDSYERNGRDALGIREDNGADYKREFARSLDYLDHSDGQNRFGDLCDLINYMFESNISPVFDWKEEIQKGIELTNDEWGKKFIKLKEYIEKHTISSETTTVLMDEPDCGLDIIDKIPQLLTVLTHYRPDTQIIATIHNPLLILGCVDQPHVNIIELQPGYLNSIGKFLIDNVPIRYKLKTK